MVREEVLETKNFLVMVGSGGLEGYGVFTTGYFFWFAPSHITRNPPSIRLTYQKGQKSNAIELVGVLKIGDEPVGRDQVELQEGSVYLGGRGWSYI